MFEITHFYRCSEKEYDVSLFEGRVLHFPFDDHNPPPLRIMLPLCKKLDEWLSKSPQNIAAIHCKAGKGRTGTIISAYMLHTKLYGSAQVALDAFAAARTRDRKGVTIPSQRRYVEYYEDCLWRGFPAQDRLVKLNRMIIHTTPHFDLDGGCDPFLIVERTGIIIFDSRVCT